jgi:hypothetical protein
MSRFFFMKRAARRTGYRLGDDDRIISWDELKTLYILIYSDVIFAARPSLPRPAVCFI